MSSSNWAKAYPVSSRFAAIESRAPIIPRPTEIAHNPGLPRPSALAAAENQLSALWNCVAITALVAVTANISMNNNKSSSKETISMFAIDHSFEKACSPIQRYDTAIPRLARLPDWRCKASPCIDSVPRRIIPATPISSYSAPVALPRASKTSVA